MKGKRKIKIAAIWAVLIRAVLIKKLNEHKH